MANKHTFIPHFLSNLEERLIQNLPEGDELEEIMLSHTLKITSDYITHVLQAKAVAHGEQPVTELYGRRGD